MELPTSISIAAVSDESLKDLILELRQGLSHAGIPDNKLYASNNIFFGNSTICRYTTTPNKRFFDKVKELKDIRLGNIKIDKILLVKTNAVFHPNATTFIDEFDLR